MAHRLLALALLAFIQCAAASTPPLNGSSTSGGGGFSLRLVAKQNLLDDSSDFASLQRTMKVKCRIRHRLLPPGAVVDAAEIRPFMCPPADMVVYHGRGRFSYCPIVPGTTTHSFLRFGADIPAQPPPKVHRQRTVVIGPSPLTDAYYIHLEGVSVGALRLPAVTPRMFERDARGGGGCAIDIGTKLSSFIAPAYAHIAKAVRDHLHSHGAQFVQRPGHAHQLCVQRTPAIEQYLPSMKLHFAGGAWLRVAPQNMFLPVAAAGGHGQNLCLGLLPDPVMTLIGAMQQINTRFIFDLDSTIPFVSFNPEDCHLDGTS